MALSQYVGGDQVDTGYPAALLKQLGTGGDTGLFNAVKIAVDAGVDGAQWNGGCKYADHGGRAGFLKQADGYVVALQIEYRCAGQR